MQFGAKESLDGRPAAPVEAVGKESETDRADVNGRGRSRSVAVDPVVFVAARDHTQLGAPSECVIIVHIIVILI